MKCERQPFGGGLSVDGRLMFNRVIRPSGFLARAMGLIGRPVPARGEAWLFEGCNCIHMFGMRYPLDVVFLDEDWRVLSIRVALKPWRVAGCRQAVSTLEIRPGGVSEAGLLPGMVFERGGICHEGDS